MLESAEQLDYQGAPMQTRSAAKRAAGDAEEAMGTSDPPQSHGDLPAHIWAAVVPFLLCHPPEFHYGSLRVWTPTNHYSCCGQGCGCCRSHSPEDAHPDFNCEECYLGWVLTTVSRQACKTAQAYAASYGMARSGIRSHRS